MEKTLSIYRYVKLKYSVFLYSCLSHNLEAFEIHINENNSYQAKENQLVYIIMKFHKTLFQLSID